jgi:uncharacterized protein YigA (DUF484 family)
LHDKLLELVAIARDNDRLAERVQRLALDLLDARGGLDELLHGIKAILRDEFNADCIALCLEAALVAGSGAEEFLRPEALALFEGLLQVGKSRCGRLRPEQATALFGDCAPQVASAALVPLGDGRWRGLLAVGSWDEQRFHPGAGTLFLGGSASWSAGRWGRVCWPTAGGLGPTRPRRMKAEVFSRFVPIPQPVIQSCVGFADTLAGQRREQLGAGARIIRCQPPFQLGQRRQRRAPAEFVRLGQQDVRRQLAGGAAVQQLAIHVGQRMADIHQQQQAAQRRAPGQIAFQQFSPVPANRVGNPGITVTRQIDQVAIRLHQKKVEQLGAAGRFADPGQLPLAGEKVDRAGFAGVGAAGEGHFPAGIGRKLGQGVNAIQKTDAAPAAGGRYGSGGDISSIVGVSH